MRPAALRLVLEAPLAAFLARADREALGAALPRAAAVHAPDGPRLVAEGTALGRLLPFGTVVLYRPDPAAPLRHRVLEVDRAGTVTAAIERGPGGELRAAWVRAAGGSPVGLIPGGARHPLWGASDRIVRPGADGTPVTLTLAGAVDWAAIDRIPPVAEPARLPPGSGAALLNLLAGLALDQGRPPLRYRGPYPTEQLFWSLVESFRCEPGPATLARFLADAEATFVRGESREVPVDWTPAPHERRLHGDGLGVTLRDGVETIAWQARAYVRPDRAGLRRREHRVVREVEAPEGRRYVASIVALGLAIEDHAILDASGEPLERRPPAPDPGPDRPVDAVWIEALGPLLALEATPLLGPAIDAVWSEVRLVWGGVPGDLVEGAGGTIRLSPKLARTYRAVIGGAPAAARRSIAHRLVREVLGLLGPLVRARAAAWLEGLSSATQAWVLAEGSAADRLARAGAALGPLGRLLDAIERAEALPT